VFEQPNSGPGAARNLAVREATGDVIVFLDDDVVPAPEFIEGHAHAHADRNDIVAIGPMLPAPDPTSPWVHWETAILEKQYRRLEAGVWQATPRQFFTGNASVRRAHVIEAGGFDPTFRRSEDVELGFRLQKLGLTFLFCSAAAAIHIAERPFDSWLKTAHQYGQNEIAIGYHKGHRDLLESVAAEFHERRPLTRAVVRVCLRWNQARPIASWLSRLITQTSFRLGLRALSRSACSGVFNLFYWYGIGDALGSTDAALRLIDSDPWMAPLIAAHALKSGAALSAINSPTDVSVVICTRDRPQLLKDAIVSVLRSLPEGSELLVVDQGEGDAVPTLLTTLPAQDGAVRYVRCRSKGISAARNEGASHARNRLLVFTDDDCVVSPNWVTEWKYEFGGLRTPAIGFGEVLPAEHDQTQGYVPGFEPVAGLYGRELFNKDVGKIGMGANMAVHKDAWEALGGFDESLGSGKRLAAAEDTDFAFRAVQAGYLVRHASSSKLVHYGFRPNSEASRLVAGYMGGIAAMYLKHARCGDGLALRLFLREGANLSRNLVRRFIARKRPLGARSLASYMRVGLSSLKLPVDARRRVFASIRTGTAV
jgi:GT2 family glycosyltransferase